MTTVDVAEPAEVAATARLSGALKVPWVTAQVTEAVTEPPTRTLNDAELVASVQAGCGAITTLRVAVRMLTPLITCSKIVYLPFTAEEAAEKVRDWLVDVVAPQLTLTPLGRPPTATFAFGNPTDDQPTTTVAVPPGEIVIVDGVNVTAEFGPVTVMPTFGSCNAPFASVA